jgi:hypothetical protein
MFAKNDIKIFQDTASYTVYCRSFKFCTLDFMSLFIAGIELESSNAGFCCTVYHAGQPKTIFFMVNLSSHFSCVREIVSCSIADPDVGYRIRLRDIIQLGQETVWIRLETSHTDPDKNCLNPQYWFINLAH